MVTVEHTQTDFDSTTVLWDLSLGMARGETFGFLGEQRVGKTNSIRAPLRAREEPKDAVALRMPFGQVRLKTVGVLIKPKIAQKSHK